MFLLLKLLNCQKGYCKRQYFCTVHLQNKVKFQKCKTSFKQFKIEKSKHVFLRREMLIIINK
jgi:hypothetical protein